MSVDGTAVTGDALRGVFATKSGDALMIVRAEKTVGWGRVVQVLDAMRSWPNRGGEFVLAVRDDPKRRTAKV